MRTTALVALLLATATGCSRSGEAPEPHVAAVLQFLIDSSGLGYFERPGTYCVAADEHADEISDEVLDQLFGRGARVVASDRCSYDESIGSVVVTDDGTPAVGLWARVATEAESEHFTPEVQTNANWWAESILVRAGFVTGQVGSADYLCWVDLHQREVIQCDVRAIS